MHKIVLLGVSSSGNSESNPIIFKNIPEKKDGAYPLTSATALLGDTPANLNNVYSTQVDNPDQMMHYRSLTKAIKTTEALINASPVNFSNGEVELHCFKVTDGSKSLIQIKDNSGTSIPSTSYGTSQNKDTLIIESVNDGDEFNYFKVSLTNTTLTVQYDPATETNSIKIIDDPEIMVPLQITLLSRSINEVANNINSSQFGKYIKATVQYYKNRITAASTSMFRLPDSPHSYRLSTVSFISANCSESFMLTENEPTFMVNNAPKKIKTVSAKIEQTVFIDTDDQSILLDDSIIVQRGMSAKIKSDPSNSVISLKYPILTVKPNSAGNTIIVEIDIQSIEDTGVSIPNLSGVMYRYEDRMFSFPFANFNGRKYFIDIEYDLELKVPKIYNTGLEGKGRIDDIFDWDQFVSDAFNIGTMPIYWTDMIDPSLSSKIKDDFEKGLPVNHYKGLWLAHINEIICSTEFASVGLDKNPNVELLLFNKGYTPWSCREINCAMILATYPGIFNINSSLSVTPPLFYFGELNNALQQITIEYSYFLNSGTFDGYLTNGSDLYDMTHPEYFDQLQDTLIKERIQSYCVDNQINDVIMCGAFINNDEKVSLNFLNKYKIYEGMVRKDATGYFYTISDVPYPDTNNPVLTSCNIPEVEPLITISRNVIRINIPIVHGNVLDDLEELTGLTTNWPIELTVQYTRIDSENVGYGDIAYNMYSNINPSTKLPSNSNIPIEIKLSAKPFNYDVSVDIQKEYDEYIQNIFTKSISYTFANHINMSIASVKLPISYEKGDIEDFINPDLFSSITEYIALKRIQSKLAINFSEIFNDVIHTKDFTELGSDLIKRCKERGLELYGASGNDEYVMCLTSNNPHKNEILRSNSYKMIIRQIMYISTNLESEFTGTYIEELVLSSTLKQRILQEFSSAIEDISLTFVDKYDRIYKYEMEFIFRKSDTVVKIPLGLKL